MHTDNGLLNFNLPCIHRIRSNTNYYIPSTVQKYRSPLHLLLSLFVCMSVCLNINVYSAPLHHSIFVLCISFFIERSGFIYSQVAKGSIFLKIFLCQIAEIIFFFLKNAPEKFSFSLGMAFSGNFQLYFQCCLIVTPQKE